MTWLYSNKGPKPSGNSKEPLPSDKDAPAPEPAPALPVNNFPIILKNTIPSEVKGNPKELAALIESCQPNASIKEIKLLSKGDIKVVGKTPHDFGILQQPWPVTDYGVLTPVLPDANTVYLSVLIFGVHLSIEINEIEEHLNSLGLFFKNVVRFTKPQSAEISTTVKVVFGSAQLREKMLKEGFHIYHQRYKVISYEKDPIVQQCYGCQEYGHSFHDCTAQSEKCLRCSGPHRIQSCNCAHADAKCSNCSGSHTANYRSCPKYKSAVAEARKANTVKINNDNNNNNNSFKNHNGNRVSNDNSNRVSNTEVESVTTAAVSAAAAAESAITVAEELLAVHTAKLQKDSSATTTTTIMTTTTTTTSTTTTTTRTTTTTTTVKFCST